VLGGGKRLRPILLPAGGPRRAGADPAGRDGPRPCAPPRTRPYLFADPRTTLPAMDDDDLRAAGRPTCHKGVRRGQRRSWPGDGLLTLAFEILARARPARGRGRRPCVRALAEASGPGGMVGGTDGRPRGRGTRRRQALAGPSRSIQPAQDRGPAFAPRSAWGDWSPAPREASLQAPGMSMDLPVRTGLSRSSTNLLDVQGGRSQGRASGGRQRFWVRKVDLSRFIRDRGESPNAPGNWPTRPVAGLGPPWGERG